MPMSPQVSPSSVFLSNLQGKSSAAGIRVAAIIAHKVIHGTLWKAPLLSSVINSWKTIEGACLEHC